MLTNTGYETSIRTHLATLLESSRIIHDQPKSQRRDRAYTSNLAHQFSLRVLLFAELLDLSIVIANSLRQLGDQVQNRQQSRFELLGDLLPDLS